MEWLPVLGIIGLIAVVLGWQRVFTPQNGVPESDMLRERRENIKRFGTSKDTLHHQDASGELT
jgi:hypothetical protein